LREEAAMAMLKDLIARTRPAGPPPAWARPLFAADLVPHRRRPDGEVLVWTVRDKASKAAITQQFKAGAEEYNRRYAASDHFEHLFRQALNDTAIAVADAPLILDLGSGSGVNSIVPCQRLFPGARMVATDLSAELLAMLGAYGLDTGATDAIACVKLDAMSALVTPAAFDLVTGAAILHHLENPEAGLAAAARALKPGGHALFFEPFNGWAILRLAFERILAEADLRHDPLDPTVETALNAFIRDVRERSDPDTTTPWFRNLDDKWLFSRSRISASAKAAGFATIRYVPHNGHQTLYRDVAGVQLRLFSGRDDLDFPPWAWAIMDSFDAAMTRDAKRELMMEGTIVLTKASA
jgi:ubiquinone/menaquinone biosynthesis C-methylase UbiE